jgi:hypothetical protein
VLSSLPFQESRLLSLGSELSVSLTASPLPGLFFLWVSFPSFKKVHATDRTYALPAEVSTRHVPKP